MAIKEKSKVNPAVIVAEINAPETKVNIDYTVFQKTEAEKDLLKSLKKLHKSSLIK